MEIVILAESREKGEKIAAGMGLSTRGNACFHGRVKGRKATLSWASGHLLQPQQPDEVNSNINWYSPHSLLPLPKVGKLVPSERGKNMLPRLKEIIGNAGEVWIATDPDREGEAIGRNILLYANYKGPSKRMWLTGSLEPNDIEKAMNNLLEGDSLIPVWHAQQARQSADWLWQMLVRAYTMQGRAGLMGNILGKGKGRESVVSVGRVQSATLKMVVERDEKIANFKPIDYFSVAIEALNTGWKYAPPTNITPERGRHEVDDEGRIYFISKQEADSFVERLQRQRLHITKADVRKQSKRPPHPHSLTSLQRTMSRKHGISSADTLKITDKIRLDGYLTYPRTEHGLIPESLYTEEDIYKQMTACMAVPSLKEAAKLMRDKHPEAKAPACYTNKPMEHHGIIPTGKVPDLSTMSTQEVLIYTECATALVRALHDPAVYNVLTAEGNVHTKGLGDEEPSVFKRNFRELIQEGYLALGADEEEEEDEENRPTTLPKINKGDEVTITNAKSTASKTRPPAHFTEDTLLSAMFNAGREAEGDEAKILREVKGIGTPATRANILETLKVRGYIFEEGKRRKVFKAHDKGKDLIKHVPDDLASVIITAKWEAELKDIEHTKDLKQSKKLRDSFIAEQEGFVTRHIEEVQEAMKDVKAAPAKRDGKPTANQLRFIQAIGKQLDVDTKEAKQSFSSASAFIDKYAKKMPKRKPSSKRTNPPTEPMKRFAQSLANERKLELPKDWDTNFDVCKKFLDENTKKKD